MIVYVDLEHERLQQQPETWEKSMAGRLKHKYRFETLSGQTCLIVRYDQISPAMLRDLRPHVQAVIVSGCHTDFEHYSADSLAGLQAIYHKAAWPTLGLCGGYQLLAQAYGGELGPISPSAADDPTYTYNSDHFPGTKHETGFMSIRAHTPHPLFAHLPEQPTIFQAHYWEIKSAPASFQILAESDICSRQAIAHTEGNVSEAAKLLGLSRSALRRRLEHTPIEE